MISQMKDRLLFNVLYAAVSFGVIMVGLVILYAFSLLGPSVLLAIIFGGLAVLFVYMDVVLILVTFVPTRYPKTCQP